MRWYEKEKETILKQTAHLRAARSLSMKKQQNVSLFMRESDVKGKYETYEFAAVSSLHLMFAYYRGGVTTTLSIRKVVTSCLLKRWKNIIHFTLSFSPHSIIQLGQTFLTETGSRPAKVTQSSFTVAPVTTRQSRLLICDITSTEWWLMASERTKTITSFVLFPSPPLLRLQRIAATDKLLNSLSSTTTL